MNHPTTIEFGAPPVRTPYHELSTTGEPIVPDWADRRSVYRTAGRTTYFITTKQFDTAREDLSALKRKGWNILVTPLGKNAANVALSRDPLALAA